MEQHGWPLTAIARLGLLGLFGVLTSTTSLAQMDCSDSWAATTLLA
jgi:hypothetical protein